MDVSQDNTKIHSSYALEQAARYIEKCLLKDSSAPTLYDMLNISQNSPTVSGLTDHDYPNMTGYSVTTNSIHQMRLFNKVPLPPEVLEHFNRILFLFCNFKQSICLLLKSLFVSIYIF